jgi:hypothetical protein
MLKKIILALLLVGFTGILVWGGVNRTLAKANENGSRSVETPGNGNRGWLENHNADECEEDGHQGGGSINPVDSADQEKSHGNGFGTRIPEGAADSYQP